MDKVRILLECLFYDKSTSLKKLFKKAIFSFSVNRLELSMAYKGMQNLYVKKKNTEIQTYFFKYCSILVENS